MEIVLQYFMIGASFMFASMMAWIFWRNGRDILSWLIVVLMLIMSAGFLKDAFVMNRVNTFPLLTIQLSVAVDIIVIPLYTSILLELCSPGSVNVRKIILLELPFVVLPILLSITGLSVFYYIDMALAFCLGLATAVWTCFAIPRYHKYLKETFSYDENINLRWLQSILWTFFLILVVWGLSCITFSAWLDIAYMAINLFLWMFICYFIYRHKSVIDEVRHVAPNVDIPADDERRADARNEIFSRIGHLIVEERIYLNPMLKLSDIASLAKTNRSYASAYFSTVAGSTFYDHINKLRVEYSLRLLSDTTKKIDEVAERSGFNSRQSFSRVFTAIMGVSPAEYRAKQQSAVNQ